MLFAANLTAQSINCFLSHKFQPGGWLLSSHRLSPQSLEFTSSLRDKAIPLFADNGTKKLIDTIIKRYSWRTIRVKRSVRKLSIKSWIPSDLETCSCYINVSTRNVMILKESMFD